MKKGILYLFAALSLVACKKRDSITETNTDRLCLDTAFSQTNINEALQAVYFINAKTGFVAGNRGGIYKTTDSAKSWATLASGITLPIDDLIFTDSLKGFAVGGSASCNGNGCIPAGGFVSRTTDGGQTWSNVYIPTEKIEIKTIRFVNPDTGWCAGGNLIMKTINGGQTWNEYKLMNAGGQISGLYFTDTQTGYAVCSNNKVAQTKDGGQTWSISAAENLYGYNTITGAAGALYIAGSNGMIKSTDGSISWARLPNAPSRMQALYFTNANEGYAVGAGDYSGGDIGISFGAIYCTSNGGRTWNGTGSVRQTYTIPTVHFFTDQRGFAVSLNRIIRLSLK